MKRNSGVDIVYRPRLRTSDRKEPKSLLTKKMPSCQNSLARMARIICSECFHIKEGNVCLICIIILKTCRILVGYVCMNGLIYMYTIYGKVGRGAG